MSQQQVYSAQNLDRDIATALVTAGKSFVVSHPKLSLWYVFGILVCIFGNGLTPAPVDVQEMELAFRQLEKDVAPALHSAYENLHISEHQYYQSKGWFSCNQACQKNKAQYEMDLGAAQALQAQYDAGIATANSKVGVFSVYGVQQARDMFWRMFGQGKQFAKRQTMWDALFVGIGAMARDESIVEYALRVLINMLFNFTIGLFGALIGFLWNLWGLVQSFGANFFTGTAFFVAAAAAASSFCMSWLIALYGAAAGTVYAVARGGMIASIEAGNHRAPRRNIHWQ